MGKYYSRLSEKEQLYIFNNAGKIPVKTMTKALKCKPDRIKRWAYKHGLSLQVKTT